MFTIAVPTFNRADWLARSVGSALHQTCQSVEVLVSDNASTDDTVGALERLADDRTVVLRQERNIGPIANWNACVSAASGTYVVMLSDDDMLEPSFLERCASLIQSHPDLPVVVGIGGVTSPADDWHRAAVRSRRLGTGIHPGTEVLAEFLRDDISPQMCTVVMRTAAVRARGGFPTDWPHLGDLAAWIPLLLQGKAGFVNESCGTRTTHELTQTANLPLAERLHDFTKLDQLIADEAERHVSDPSVLAAIRDLTRRYVARNCLGHIAIDRRAGESRRVTVRAVRTHREQLAGLSWRDLGTVPRPLVLFALPVRIVNRLSRLKHRWSQREPDVRAEPLTVEGGNET
jgi:glycosyltransferase involved in cell wall biosynthesis